MADRHGVRRGHAVGAACEALLERVEGAGADVAVDDAQGPDRQRQELAVTMVVGNCGAGRRRTLTGSRRTRVTHPRAHSSNLSRHDGFPRTARSEVISCLHGEGRGAGRQTQRNSPREGAISIRMSAFHSRRYVFALPW